MMHSTRSAAPALRRDRRIFVGRSGAFLTLADQFVSSASNFALGVVIARVGGANALGAFGVAFVVWLAVLGINRAVVTEPMTVRGTPPGKGDLVEGCAASLLLGVVAGVALAVVGGGLVLVGAQTGAFALFALAPWLPTLLAQDYCRSMAFR